MERESEYNRDYFQKRDYPLENLRDFSKFTANIVVLVDYYNVTVRWYHESGQKVSKSFYIHRDLPEYESAEILLSMFIEYCIDTFQIKPTI